jgi:subtilisin family serine protease
LTQVLKVNKYLTVFFCSLALVGMFACSSNLPGTTTPEGQLNRAAERDAIGTRYIVTLKADVSGSVREFVENLLSVRLKDEFSAQPIYFYEQVKAFALDVPGQPPDKVERTLSQIEGVEHVGRDHLVSIEQATQSWGLDRIDQQNPEPDGKYNSTFSGRGVSVYIVDTGIRITHQDFSGRASVAYDAVDDDDNIYTPSTSDRRVEIDGLDCQGHGTHVAGTVGGRNYGVAKDTTIFSVRVIGRNEEGKIVEKGCGRFGLQTEIIAGIDWITANHRRPSIVNLSIGGDYDRNFNLAVERSIAAGIVYVAAAGNDNKDLSGNSPASAQGIIPVGATGLRQETSGKWIDYRWSYSRYGSNYGANIIFAPGAGIESAGYLYDDDYATKDGTSMAAPHVTGVVAQYLQAHPGSSQAAVMKVIEDNATRDQVDNPGPGSRNLLLYSGFQ